MTWFRVDDAWWSHPKVVSLSLAGRGLWVTAGSWCAQHLQDGKVPRSVLSMLGGTPKVAAELVASGLWVATAEGWLVHDWHRYQPSRADVEREREQKRQRQKKWKASHPSGDASPAPSQDASKAGLGDTPITIAPTRAFSRPVPSRPDQRESALEPDDPDRDPDETLLDSLSAVLWPERNPLNDVPHADRARIRKQLSTLRHLAEQHGTTPIAVLSAARDRFDADPEVGRKRLSYAVLLSQLHVWGRNAPHAAVAGPAPKPPPDLPPRFDPRCLEEPAT